MSAQRAVTIEVRDNPRASRFEAYVGDEQWGILTYERRRRRTEIIHTVTDPARRGQGVASALAGAAFADARARGSEVLIICPFVESWLDRHPEHADIVLDD
ncbi:GNAT family N-acetyltransferase [Brachybacterium phenoliresistens]|uniref:Acetyltransferase n=1 Tax=Brachybacterium phenoliresistens TaxID=396014 RepID=Z9JTA1_9MICO|nr:GNAT family N-acetyltransferase [Brachybacterium phenoliresistens]EWS81580.1 acetyltransferase [Brachybacterium phenoliresistens]